MTKAEQARIVACRLRILRHAENEPRQVARTRRYFGISRTAFHRWKKRFDELGEAGLADRPRAPHCSPRATSRAVVSKVLNLRQNYHFGADRIAAYLQRFHQVDIARSTVHRVLVRNDMARLPANQKHRPHRKRWKRYEKALEIPEFCGHWIQHPTTVASNSCGLIPPRC
jgi:transposase